MKEITKGFAVAAAICIAAFAFIFAAIMPLIFLMNIAIEANFSFTRSMVSFCIGFIWMVGCIGGLVFYFDSKGWLPTSTIPGPPPMPPSPSEATKGDRFGRY